MQANKKYIYVSEKHPFICCPVEKHPKNSTSCGLQTLEKKPVNFFMIPNWHELELL